MIAEIISIGDEILIGQVVNTNATWISQHLNEAGIQVGRVLAIADDAEEIKSALDNAFPRADVILLTGGLGPTKDDITKNTLCEYFNTSLVFHQPSFENIERLFAARYGKITGVNRRQAEIPATCTPLLNEQGTAPGMWFEREGKIVVSMPGVPFEMESIMEKHVLPRLTGLANEQIIVHKTVMTQGIGESSLAELIKDWEENLPSYMKLAYLPQPGLVRLRLTARGESREMMISELNLQVEALKKLIPGIIYGYDDDMPEQVAGRLLKKTGKTLCTAESCTGGYLSHLVTSVPGSSEYYLGSVIAYSNPVKMSLLGVSESSLRDHGAVSEQVVKEMATGARLRFRADYAISISGIAGPDGGTAEKPVGTVWIALASESGITTKMFTFGEHRGRNIRRAALAALNMLREELEAVGNRQ
jgi:nicotinamide-nucleotide amidase